ncbi:flavodoxin-dependent (E)-4-hydroxy-3-methylbut-2-enyl-diphosphate synthase [Desulfuribacillus alkaliarsenatis]|uniref:4-hydroxy-3-methylbut-2-en-1-yl diphosphate synthase (flavodoxin) n=1 Tax=Desulfuribacillus alkaliarsenatis TaxID=766136 RepID=A0A1E5G636_9FIRM|nr:flavodoxin-dependent (E)-4-hydroxy-3-methylbut-2-enyl-diphosphate synthase [Desulfuribacillus alkaliarsenatis]OEF98640.1 4-hydroxy-3-methylbut-2-en-1-yl diphosphate synthase [Desulfuribacillus alkaliarsenatis]
MYRREQTLAVKVGNVQIGGSDKVTIQSMTTTDTRDIASTMAQIERLAEAGCEIVRVAVLDIEAAKAIKELKKLSPLPIVADIHFDHKLALEALENGVDKIRINPGNIGGKDKLKQVVELAKANNVPIRIGVNSGSIERELLQKYGHPTAEAMVESAEKHIQMLEELDFTDIVISLKASNVPLSIQAYQLMAARRNYPLHVGITEAGTVYQGTIKSAVGIGSILSQGIGNTIRVSLTGDPVEEIKAAKVILKSLQLYDVGPELISCPTCGRCQIPLIELANQVEKEIEKIKKPVKVAVMGCAVNGPGEAREADIGIAGGKGEGLIFRKGKIIRKVKEDVLLEEFKKELDLL